MFNKKKAKPEKAVPDKSADNESADNQVISTEILQQMLSGNEDIIFNNINVNNRTNLNLTVVFIDGMMDPKLVDDDVLRPLMQEDILGKAKNQKEIIDLIMQGSVYHCQRKLRDKLDDCISDLLSGSVVLIFDDSAMAVTFEIKGFEKRGITEPSNENVIKGSKESFIEVLRVNTALIRRRIQTSDLKIHQLVLGKRTNTNIGVVYIQNIANPQIVNEVKLRLERIDIDGIVSAAQVETLIMDKKWTLFPQLIYTERVDKFCANILEGRVGIIIDGIPIAYIVPVDINSFFQAPEDYALNFFQSSFFRILRFSSAFTAPDAARILCIYHILPSGDDPDRSCDFNHPKQRGRSFPNLY